MRQLALLFLCFQTLAASALQLDLALIQFPEPKTAEQLNAALEGTRLADLANSDRTATTNPVLKGGTILLARSAPLSCIDSSTRIGAIRADIQGTHRNGRLDLRITLAEGVQSGLRSFSSRTYQGSAPLPPGPPLVIALRTITSKTQTSVKGVPSVKESSSCHAILAQLR